MNRRAAIKAGARSAGIPVWSSDIKPVRGKCLGRVKRGKCGSRWAIPRVSLDFRDATRIDRLAVLECARCGRVWRRIKADQSVRSREGYLTAKLTLILPASINRWYSHGAWHREGDDALVLVNATVADLDDAVEHHRKRADAREAGRARAKAKAYEADVIAIARSRAMLDQLAERDAAEAEAEREAAMREG